MATMRTPEERAAIAARCIELEKEGGDILGYLWSENYLTPRATWCNIQREWLGRKPYEFTDGKPKEKKRKEKGNMAKRRSLTAEERAEAIRIALDGGDPRKYLEEIGISEPSNTWAYIKMTEKQRNPEVYAQIPKRLPVNGLKNKAVKEAEPDAVLGRPKEDFEQMPTLKVDGAIRIETPEADKVTVAEVPEKPKITKPVNYDGFDVRGVKGEFGTYSYSEFPSGKYLDYDSDGDSLSMTIEKWRGFIAELKRAALVLGVEL